MLPTNTKPTHALISFPTCSSCLAVVSLYMTIKRLMCLQRQQHMGLAGRRYRDMLHTPVAREGCYRPRSWAGQYKCYVAQWKTRARVGTSCVAVGNGAWLLDTSSTLNHGRKAGGRNENEQARERCAAQTEEGQCAGAGAGHKCAAMGEERRWQQCQMTGDGW